MCNYTKREQAMVIIRPGVWCDPCLVPLVRALYENGFPTIASCCGHGKRPGHVILADDREVFIASPEDAEIIHHALHVHQMATDPEYAADYQERTGGGS